MAVPTSPDLILSVFANAGDVTAPPQTDPNGFVNFSQGYTPDYEIDLSSGNTSAKAVERPVQNYLFQQLTANLQFWQTLTYAPWYSTMPGGYNRNAIVGRVSTAGNWTLWRSTINANVTDPNQNGQSNWEYVPFVSEIYANVPMPSGGISFIRPGISSGELIAAATDFNTLQKGTWEFSTDAIANSSPNAPVQLGATSTFAGMLESKSWTSGTNTFITQRYSDRTGNAFFRGAQNGTWTSWISITPVPNFSVDSSATANLVQGNALLAIATLIDNQQFWVQIANANTGATTFSPNPSITAQALLGGAQLPLQGGELIVGGRALVLYRLATNNFILVECTGGALQIAPAVASNQAVTLGQMNARLYKLPGSTTAATANFTVPPGIFTIYASGCAAGGGGGGGGFNNSGCASSGGAGGGAGQSLLRQAYAVTPGQVLALTAGAAGTGGTAGTAGTAAGNGGNGGDTIIGTLVTLTHGSGGGAGSVGISTAAVAGPQGAAGFPNGGDATDGSTQAVITGYPGSSGEGGSGPFGGGGGRVRHSQATPAFNGKNAFIGFGGGGSGGGGLYVTSGNGGIGAPGGPGLIILEW